MRAVPATFVTMSLAIAFVRVRMGMGRVIDVLPGCCAVMLSKGHTQPGRDGRHALDRQGERNRDSKQAKKLQAHGRIVLHRFQDASVDQFRM